MALVRLDQACLAYGDHPLLDHVDWVVQPGERIALIGRNGAGKSTLLKVLSGAASLDGGTLWRRPQLRVGVLEQELPEADQQTAAEVVSGGLAEVQGHLAEYDRLSTQAGDPQVLKRLEALQQEIEAADGWNLGKRVDRVLTRLRLPANKTMGSLSGGWRRRVALGRALVSEPDILILDEPTNHLDLPTISWLEEQLLEFRGTLIFVTHDRTFLQRLANRIVELDRGRLLDRQGDYQSFLAHREQLLNEEARHNALFDKRLAEEETWIRQGIKARRTRNEGRVRALKAMREERMARREQQGRASFSVEQARRSGKLVAEAEEISFSHGKQRLVTDFSVRIMRGDRIGLLGPNGAGKSTLLKLLLGKLAPDSGRLELGTNLEVAYFDQLREQLDPDKTVMDNVCEGREFITINGKSRHVISYLEDFLFSPPRTRAKVSSLSGGERNRLLLARLFSKPANLLVMDEPTNDLDLETLELLEEILCDFDGTLLLVSHDRAFIDNVVTSTLVFEGAGQIREYVGGFEDWLRQGGRLEAAIAPEGGSSGKSDDKPVAQSVSATARPQKSPARKLSYKLQRELDSLPAQMEALEAELAALQEETTAPDFYQQDHSQVAARLEALKACETALEEAMERWVELEALSEEG